MAVFDRITGFILDLADGKTDFYQNLLCLIALADRQMDCPLGFDDSTA